MYNLIMFLAFSTVLLETVSSAQELVDPFLTAHNPCSQIRNAQFICVDCQTTGFCSQVNGAWVTAEVGKCEGFLFCNERARGCSYSQECSVPLRGPKFECQNPGLYPDPFDCKYYHECSVSNVETTRVCDNGMGYSLALGTCSLNKQSQECKQKQYECQKTGQTAAWPGEPNIYYVCIPRTTNGQMVLYPLLYRCPKGQVFDETQCVSSDAQTQSGEDVIPTDDIDVEKVNCRKGSLIEVPSDCRGYTRCGDSLLMRCPLGSHFNQLTESCVPGSC